MTIDRSLPYGRLRAALPIVRTPPVGPLLRIIAAVLVASCGGGGGSQSNAPHGLASKIAMTATGDARADAATYLKKLCPKPIGGELNFMVWEGYTDSVFTAPFERACGVKITATYMGSSDDLVAKLRAGGSQTIDLISPSSDAITEIIQAGLAAALDTTRLPSFGDLMAGFARYRWRAAAERSMGSRGRSGRTR